jgi:putative ABC transport system permease protein
MYPELRTPLLVIVTALALGLTAAVLRQPVARWLGFRQVARRRGEAMLVIAGSVLGTAIIIGALVVGDTLGFSVKQEAYRSLGPVDERISAQSTTYAGQLNFAAAALQSNPDVDGVLKAVVDQAAATRMDGTNEYAEPRVLAWEVDFADARRFGGDPHATGISGRTPGLAEAVLNEELAKSVHAKKGDTIDIFLYGQIQRLDVIGVLPQRGLAGMGIGSTVNRNVFLAPGSLANAAAARGAQPRPVVLVSNRGGVESGADLTPQVSKAIRAALGGASARIIVDEPKREVLRAAKTAGDSLGSLFLMIGSFSIIAGALLLVNIFVMLGEERKSQLGMLRAVGMRRRVLIAGFTLEGAVYALVSLVPAVLLGLGVGWAVAAVAARIFESWSTSGDALHIAFDVRTTSIVNGVAMGLIVSLIAVLLTSVRISRFNVIAAIRDLPNEGEKRARRRTLVLSTTFAVLAALMAVPAVASSQAEGTMLLPSLSAILLLPLLKRLMPPRLALSLVAGGVLGWTLLASVVRPRIYDTPSMAIYVILGCLASFSAVVLISENQAILVRPLRRLLQRPNEKGLATRLAVAYPVSKRFRTGTTLVMYTLITLVLVLLTQINGVISDSVDGQVRDSTAGYALRVDFNPNAGLPDLLAAMQVGSTAHDIATVTPLKSARALAADPGKRTTDPIETLAVGIPPNSITTMAFDRRLTGFANDAAVWRALYADPEYVVLDGQFGATGGPPSRYYDPGDEFFITDPTSGRVERKIIAGVLRSGLVFYATDGTMSYPVVMNNAALTELFGSGVRTSSALVRARPGVDPELLASRLQGRFFASSLIASPIESTVRRMFAANTAFFRLMQGFLGLGLLVGIAGLGVVMVRAVRERRRTIGVLRALGVRSRVIQRAFLQESAFVAAQGVVLGSVLGVVTTWLMYLKSATFDTLDGGFRVQWTTIVLLCAATFVVSLLATVAPARRAARIHPAVAVRVAD